MANLCAWPLAYLFLHRWLMNFAYRTTIDWYVFILSGVVTVIIAFLTISIQAIKAALTDPIKALRNE
ncbi:MAG: hypothetical protein PHU88_00925 [candidate division Zixibacteria bacterium]|nr:hypothetical protein [candidate division Zixibacteria bacterium]MDD5425549.1 hypothetical protein [candidate division Zixibacteria bacterium]